MDEFAAHPIEVTNKNFETGEVTTYWINTEFDEESTYDVADAWEEMESDIWNENFCLTKFQKLARMTFKLLQPHFCRDEYEDYQLPCEYVNILLAIQSVAKHVLDVGKEAEAAKLVAWGFINNTLWGIGDQLPIEESAKVFRFDCRETNKTYDIDPETFDLTELIHDIEKMEENET